MLKKITFWLAFAAAVIAVWPKRDHMRVIQTPMAVIVTDGATIRVAPKPEPKTYTEFREAHEPAEAAPAREQKPAATITKRERAPAREQMKAAKRKSVTVKPAGGGHEVGYSCATLKGYLDTYGYSLVVASAPAYGYSKADVDGAKKACGL